jgi:hypothetical protein
MILALFSVVPVTVAVVLFTKRGKRNQAFRQMMYYPAAPWNAVMAFSNRPIWAQALPRRPWPADTLAGKEAA